MSVLMRCLNHHHNKNLFNYMDHIAKDGDWRREDGCMEFYYTMDKDSAKKLLQDCPTTLKNADNEIDEAHFIGLEMTYIYDENGIFTESYIQGMYEYDDTIENGQIEDILFDDTMLQQMADNDCKVYLGKDEIEKE